MTPFETVLFAAGIALTARFLLRTAFPAARYAVDATAERRARDLREEFMRLSPGQARLALFAASGATGTLAASLLGNIPAALAAAVLPLLGSGIAVRCYAARRRRRVIAQLPAFIDLLCGHIKAGHSMPDALARIQETLPRGIREEIAWVVQNNRLGTPLPACLAQWEERLPLPEISLVVRPLAAALPAGGNIVDLLVRTRGVLRMEARSRERLKSMTAQARLQALVLTLLPPAFAAAISAVDPAYLPRILGSPQGRAILAAAALLQAAGWLVMRKILSEKP